MSYIKLKFKPNVSYVFLSVSDKLLSEATLKFRCTQVQQSSGICKGTTDDEGEEEKVSRKLHFFMPIIVFIIEHNINGTRLPKTKQSYSPASSS